MNPVDAATSKRRLLLLVEKLRSVPLARFDYGLWVGDDWKGAADLSCGTTACALGWATAVPEIAEAGLCMRRGNTRGFVSLEDEGLLDGKTNEYSAPIMAAKIVFGLGTEEATFLFIPEELSPSWMDGAEYAPEEDASAAEVADHIEQFVMRKWPQAWEHK